jgi:hypothetical protein
MPAVKRDNAIPAVWRDIVIKVRVTVNGEIAAAGQPVTLETLAARFADLKRAGGVVWYYREYPAREPQANVCIHLE